MPKSAYNYFDDMRQKYAETSSCKYMLLMVGQDNVLRIWVLKSAYNYFDDMRQKYAETSSCKHGFL